MLEPKVEMKLNGTDWADVSTDVLPPIYCSSGIMGNSPTDRVASPGMCTFQLNNSISNSGGLDGYYSPGHANCRTGFQAGLILRVTFTFDNSTVTKWYGRIAPDGIIVDPHSKGPRRTTITAYDWMYQAVVHKLYLPSYTTSKKMNEVMPLIVANMPIAPLSNSYAVGQDTFASVFDTVRYNTTAMAEFHKLAMSELGYVYLTHGASDEILVSEDRLHRNNVIAIATIPVPSTLADYLTDEDGNYITTEAGDYIVLDQRSDISLDNKMSGLEYTHGANLYNWVNAVSYPKNIDADATTVLFALNTRVTVEAGETLSGFRITYRDPTGGAKKVAGKDMVTPPLADTDYWMDSVSGSNSKDLTADLTVVVTYGTEGAEYSLENTGASTGYVYLQFRGRGIYIYDPVTKIFTDTTSIDIHGTHELTLDLKYQNDPIIADAYGNIILNHYKNPSSHAKTATFTTRTDDLVGVFLQADCGSKVTITEDQTGIDEDYFINGWEFEVLPNARNAISGNLVSYKWYLKQATADAFVFATWDTTLWGAAEGWDF